METYRKTQQLRPSKGSDSPPPLAAEPRSGLIAYDFNFCALRSQFRRCIFDCRHRNGNGNGGIKKASDAIIWLCIESKSFNIDYFTMSKTSTPPTVPTPSPSEPLEDGGPWEGVAATVPGTIQAEEFDEGGEGVAYSDSSQGNNKGVRGSG